MKTKTPLLEFRIDWNADIYPTYALQQRKYFLGMLPYWSTVATSWSQWDLLETAEKLSKPYVQNRVETA